MIKTYAKGRGFESDMLHYLNSKGFSCIRAPSSGGAMTPADVIAMRKGMILALELKNHKLKPKLTQEKVEKFKEWCERAGAIGFLVWKNGTKWLFLQMKDIVENNYEDERWIEMKDILSALGVE